ncbi:hypothetical protein [Paraglaciecola aestuariivivens]
MESFYQSGYFHLPSFNLIKRGIKFSGDNFEWSLVALLLVWLILSPIHNKYRTQQIIDSPQRNDFYFVDYFALNDSSDARYRYIPMRVVAVTETSVVVKVGNIAHTTKATPREHLKSDRAMQKNFYRKDTIEIPLRDLPKLLASKVIYNAARPNNIYINGWIVMHEREL